MACEFIDDAYKTGAGRLIQEPGALRRVGAEAARLGNRALLVGGPRSLPRVRVVVEESLEAAGVPCVTRVHGEPNSYEEAHRIAGEALEAGCKVVVGVGGGRIMDAAKAIAASAGLPLVEAPTNMATCAAFTPLSVMYTEEGAFAGTWRYETEVDAVVVDTEVLAHEPARCVAAGVLDSMAKVFEIQHGMSEVQPEAMSVQRLAAYRYAQANNAVLERFGKQAYDDVAAGRVSEAVEQVAFTNIALTGIVSSLTRGYHQTALAHKLYDGLRSLFADEVKDRLHGELVAVGLLMQLAYNGQMDEIPQLRAFMESMGMACSLADLGIASDDPRRDALRDYVGVPEFVPAEPHARMRFNEAFGSIG